MSDMEDVVEVPMYPDFNASCFSAWVNESRHEAIPLRGLAFTFSSDRAAIIVMCISLLTSLVAYLFSVMRKIIYRDSDNLDTLFDGGGCTSSGLTAATVAAQYSWSVTLFMPFAYMSEMGAGGVLWYAIGMSNSLLMFSSVAFFIKMVAPGAKTYLQPIHARFGPRVHILFIMYSLTNNLIVTGQLIYAGSKVLSSMVAGMSAEMSAIFFVSIVLSFDLIGGVGASFYVCYFSTIVTLVVLSGFVLCAFHLSSHKALGNLSSIYEHIICINHHPHSLVNSSHYLTFAGTEALIFGISSIANFGSIFLDQSYWQQIVASKPGSLLVGFFLGSIIWMPIPITFGYAMCLTYLSVSSYQGISLKVTTNRTEPHDLVPLLGSLLLGSSGVSLLTIILLLMVMTTASAEIMAVNAVLVYDIYPNYFRPYRRGHTYGTCMLCGRNLKSKATSILICRCTNSYECFQCMKDRYNRWGNTSLVLPHYECRVHGEYNRYLDQLMTFQNGSTMILNLSLLPLYLLIDYSGLDLNYIALIMNTVLNAGVPPLVMAFTFKKITSRGMMFGVIGGSICGFVALLATAATYKGSLSNFVENTSRTLSVLCGNVASAFFGFLFCLCFSARDTFKYPKEEFQRGWLNMREIDNPISPWKKFYVDQFRFLRAYHEFDENDRPTIKAFSMVFKKEYVLLKHLSITIPIVILTLIPGILYMLSPLSFPRFFAITIFLELWLYLATLGIMFYPFYQEFLMIKTIVKEQEFNFKDLANFKKKFQFVEKVKLEIYDNLKQMEIKEQEEEKRRRPTEEERYIYKVKKEMFYFHDETQLALEYEMLDQMEKKDKEECRIVRRKKRKSKKPQTPDEAPNASEVQEIEGQRSRKVKDRIVDSNKLEHRGWLENQASSQDEFPIATWRQRESLFQIERRRRRRSTLVRSPDQSEHEAKSSDSSFSATSLRDSLSRRIQPPKLIGPQSAVSQQFQSRSYRADRAFDPRVHRVSEPPAASLSGVLAGEPSRRDIPEQQGSDEEVVLKIYKAPGENEEIPMSAEKNEPFQPKMGPATADDRLSPPKESQASQRPQVKLQPPPSGFRGFTRLRKVIFKPQVPDVIVEETSSELAAKMKEYSFTVAGKDAQLSPKPDGSAGPSPAVLPDLVSSKDGESKLLVRRSDVASQLEAREGPLEFQQPQAVPGFPSPEGGSSLETLVVKKKKRRSKEAVAPPEKHSMIKKKRRRTKISTQGLEDSEDEVLVSPAGTEAPRLETDLQTIPTAPVPEDIRHSSDVVVRVRKKKRRGSSEQYGRNETTAEDEIPTAPSKPLPVPEDKQTDARQYSDVVVRVRKKKRRGSSVDRPSVDPAGGTEAPPPSSDVRRRQTLASVPEVRRVRRRRSSPAASPSEEAPPPSSAVRRRQTLASVPGEGTTIRVRRKRGESQGGQQQERSASSTTSGRRRGK